MENLLKLSFVNFYLGVSWALLMFLILVASVVYTYKQHLRVKRLSNHVSQLTWTPDTKEQQPLVPRIDMEKLGSALNRRDQQ